eukprot:scaffold113544_cov30-Tisochrysis_lutea.AAC.3
MHSTIRHVVSDEIIHFGAFPIVLVEHKNSWAWDVHDHRHRTPWVGCRSIFGHTVMRTKGGCRTHLWGGMGVPSCMIALDLRPFYKRCPVPGAARDRTALWRERLALDELAQWLASSGGPRAGVASAFVHARDSCAGMCPEAAWRRIGLAERRPQVSTPPGEAAGDSLVFPCSLRMCSGVAIQVGTSESRFAKASFPSEAGRILCAHRISCLPSAWCGQAWLLEAEGFGHVDSAVALWPSGEECGSLEGSRRGLGWAWCRREPRGSGRAERAGRARAGWKAKCRGERAELP